MPDSTSNPGPEVLPLIRLAAARLGVTATGTGAVNGGEAAIPTVTKLESQLLDRVGRAMGRFAMLKPGDRIAVGVSGGKDSLTLLHALVGHRRRAPFSYDVFAITVEQGKFRMPISRVRQEIEGLGVEWILVDDRTTLRLVRDGVLHGCDVCSRHRRRTLYQTASQHGATALALGHTADDCAEALLRNVLFNGRIASLPPVATSRKGGLRLIRPLVHVDEAMTSAYASARGFLTVPCVCGERESVRREIRAFLDTMRARHPGVAESLMGALGNVNPYTLHDRRLSAYAAIVASPDDTTIPAADAAD